MFIKMSQERYYAIALSYTLLTWSVSKKEVAYRFGRRPFLYKKYFAKIT